MLGRVRITTVCLSGPVTRSAVAGASSGVYEEQDENASLAANGQRPVSGDVADKRKRRQPAPRRFVSGLANHFVAIVFLRGATRWGNRL